MKIDSARVNARLSSRDLFLDGNDLEHWPLPGLEDLSASAGESRALPSRQ